MLELMQQRTRRWYGIVAVLVALTFVLPFGAVNQVAASTVCPRDIWELQPQHLSGDVFTTMTIQMWAQFTNESKPSGCRYDNHGSLPVEITSNAPGFPSPVETKANSQGVVSYSFVPVVPGEYWYTIKSLHPTRHLSVAGTITVIGPEVPKTDTDLALQLSRAAVDVGETVSITAVLTADGAPLPHQYVEIVAENERTAVTSESTLRTNSLGRLTWSWQPPEAGAWTIRAQFAGDDTYASAAAGPVDLTVNRLATVVNARSPQVITYGSGDTLKARLQTSTGRPLGGHTLSLYINAEMIGGAVTTWDGRASFDVAALPVGDYTYHIGFFGDETHADAAAFGLLQIVEDVKPIATRLTFRDAPYTVAAGEPQTIAAVLEQQAGGDWAPLADAAVTLQIGHDTYDVQTDADGLITYDVTLDIVATYNVTAAFAEAGYTEATATTTLTVTPPADEPDDDEPGDGAPGDDDDDAGDPGGGGTPVGGLPGGGLPSGGSSFAPPAVAAAPATEITPQTGGTVRTADDRVTLHIPAGAVTEPVFVTIETATGDFSRYTTGYLRIDELIVEVTAETADGRPVTEFLTDVVFTFRVLPTDLKDGYGQNDLIAFYWDVDLETWIAIPTQIGNGVGEITATVDHLTTFALLGDKQFPRQRDIAGHWAEADVLQLLSTGVVDGIGGGMFAPDGSVTRAEFAKMLVLGMGLQPAADPQLTFADAGDIPDWAAGYVAAAVAAGYIEGLDGNRFGPHERITREQMATMVARALNLAATETTSFPDEGDVSDWASDAVQAALEHRIMFRREDGEFEPQDEATRAEAARAVARLQRLRFRGADDEQDA